MTETEWMHRVLQLIRERHPQLAKRLIAEGQQLFTDACGQATALLLLGELAEARHKMQEAVQHYGQAAEAFRPLAAVVPQRLVRALIGHGATLHYTGRYETAIACFEEGIAICEKEKLMDDLCRCLRSAGFNHHVLGHYEKALQLTERALQLATEHQLPERMGDALRNLAGMHWDAGRDDIALKYNLQSLELARQYNNEAGIGFILNNMALLHISRHDYVLAQQCLDEADYLLGHRKDTKVVTRYNRCKLHYHQNQFHESLTAARQAAQMALELNDEMRYAFALEYISKALHKLNRSAEGIQPQQQALDYFLKTKRRDSTVTSYMHLGRLYTALQQLAEARSALTTARQLAEKDGLNPFLFEAHELLSELEEAAGNPRQALEHFKQAFEYRKKVFTTESESEMNRLKVQFETEKKERELALLRQEKESSVRTFAIAQKKNKLIAREHVVLKLLVQGNSYKLAAAQLGIAYETTREHIANLYKKLGVSTNTEAVSKAVKEGLV